MSRQRLNPQDITRIRLRAGLTPPELAEYLGVPTANVTTWEQTYEPIYLDDRLAKLLFELATGSRPGAEPDNPARS